MRGVRRFDRIQSSVLLTHSASISSCNSIILLYSDVFFFLFCILRNPNLQGIDFFVFRFGNLLREQRDEMREMRDSVRTDDLSRVIW